MFSLKFSKNVLNSSSEAYLLETVVGRSPIKRCSRLIASSFIEKETPTQVLLCEFYAIFQDTVLENTSGRQVLICSFYRSCFSTEGSCSCFALSQCFLYILCQNVHLKFPEICFLVLSQPFLRI